MSEGRASRHLVDPELARWIDLLALPDLSLDTLPAFRQKLDSGIVPAASIEGTNLRLVTVPGLPGSPDVAAVVIRPTAATGPLPCVLHFHGGAFVAGRARADEAAHRALVQSLACLWVSVDYRLAPETPFPGALDDGQAVLDWLFSNAAALDIDVRRIGLVGESAGGGLAACLALRLRDSDGPRLAFQHLTYPMLDDRTGSAVPPHPYAGEFVWTARNNAFAWSAWLGRPAGSAGVSAYAAAARAQDLSGLPPTFMATGALDLFLEENLDFARRLLCAGVATELHVYPGAFHGFDLDPCATVSLGARRHRREALRRALHPGGQGRA